MIKFCTLSIIINLFRDFTRSTCRKTLVHYCLPNFLTTKITTVGFLSSGATRPTAGGTGYELVFLQSPLSSPSWLSCPPFFLFSGNSRIVSAGGPRNQPSGEPGGVVASGGGDDHASEAGGAAAGAPDPVGTVLLRRARRLLAQPPHRLQVRLPSTC